jgi:hypothetical protein
MHTCAPVPNLGMVVRNLTSVGANLGGNGPGFGFHCGNDGDVGPEWCATHRAASQASHVSRHGAAGR